MIGIQDYINDLIDQGIPPREAATLAREELTKRQAALQRSRTAQNRKK